MVLVGQEHWPKIQVVHCGLDPTEFDGTPPPPGDDELRLITVGDWNVQKGHTLLLDAVAAVREQVSLHVVGDGSELEALRAQRRAPADLRAGALRGARRPRT